MWWTWIFTAVVLTLVIISFKVKNLKVKKALNISTWVVVGLQIISTVLYFTVLT